MKDDIFAIHANKIITVSKMGTIEDGIMIIKDGKIKDIGRYSELSHRLEDIKVYDCSDKIITPSLVDCHCHLLEYGSGSFYPLTEETYIEGGKSLLLRALLNGITSIGEQICGSPICNISLEEYMKVVHSSPIRIKYSLNTITIGTEEFPNYSCLYANKEVSKDNLIDVESISNIAIKNQFPGENVFINATPANLPISQVPRAGELVYSEQELKSIVDIYHKNNSRIGAHVAGIEGIDMAINTGIDVIHHGHGISDEQIDKVAKNHVAIVATPLGGTHLQPNMPEEILKLVSKGVNVSIATDAYLPPASYLNLDTDKLYGSDVLMLIAKGAMNILNKNGYDENICLSLITSNPAKILGIDNIVGKLEVGMEADFLVSNGIPGLEIVDCSDISCVYIKGKKVISR